MALALLDWFVVALYIGVVIVLGAWAMRRVKDPGGFILGRRKMGKVMMVASTFVGGIPVSQPIAIASATFRNGLSGIWLSLSYMLIMPVMWLYPPVLRRTRIVTGIDMIRMRFGHVMEWLLLLTGILSGPLGMAGGLKAAGDVVVVMSRDATGSPTISPTVTIAMVAIPAVLYGLMGGVVAVMTVAQFQGILIIALSFLVLPYAVWKVGGIAALSAKVPAAHWELFGAANTQFSGLWLFWFVVGLFFAFSNTFGGGAITARNELSARLMICGLVIKRFCTLGWALIGIFAVAVLGGQVAPDTVFARMCAETLPAGLRGVMIASVLSLAMSGIAGSVVGFGGTIVNNLYKPYLVKEKTDRHYLFVARLCAVSVMVAGWAIASRISDLVTFVVMMELFATLTGVPRLLTLFWRRITATATLVSVAVMSPLFYAPNWYKIGEFPAHWQWYQAVADALVQLYRQWGFTIQAAPGSKYPLEVWTPIYLIPGILSLLAVSLFTKHHNDRDMAEFYARLDTPVGEEQKLRDAGFCGDDVEKLDGKPVVVEKKDHDISRRLLLLDFFDWPWLILTGKAQWRDYWLDFAGIAGVTIFVIAFLWFVKFVAAALH